MPIESFYISFKAHTISNKLVSKVFAQKKGEKSYAATNICYNFVGFRYSPPLMHLGEVFRIFVHYLKSQISILLGVV